MGEPAYTPVASSAAKIYTFGPFEVDVATCQLRRDGTVVSLTPKGFDLLLLLIRNRERVVPKDELLKTVWSGAFVSEDNLTSTIWVIRRTLGDDSNQSTFIATVPRRGYRFIARVTEVAPEDLAAPVRVALPQSHPAFPEPARATEVLPSPRNARADRGVSPWWLVAAGAATGALVLALTLTLWPAAEASSDGGGVAARFTLDAPEGSIMASGAVTSPDGRMLVFTAQDADGRIRLWVRPLDGNDARPLAGTDGAARPFWAPTGEAVAFFAGSALKIVSIEDGVSRVVARNIGPTPLGGSWGTQGTIVFSASGRTHLSMVPALGGTVQQATTLNVERRDVSHQWPAFLPDGQRFLFTVSSSDPERSGIYAGSIDGGEPRLVVAGLTGPTLYAPPGYLLNISNRALRAVQFDPASLQTRGAPAVVADDVSGPGPYQMHALSVSGNGVLTFGGGMVPERLVWYDTQGTALGEIKAGLFNMEMAPDGRQVLASGPLNGRGTGVWLLDVERGVPTQIVADGNLPVWGPDGDRIAYTASRKPGDESIYLRSIRGGANTDTLLFTHNTRMWLDDWSKDGRYVIFTTLEEGTKQDLWRLSVTGGEAPVALLQSPASEHQAKVSPDGRAVAYISDESGRWNVYVDTFPTLGARRVISADGGAQPRWSASGRQLYYVSPTRQLMVVDVERGADWRIGRPRPLFQIPVRLDGAADQRNFYTAALVSDRFLVERATRVPATVLLNWQRRIAGF